MASSGTTSPEADAAGTCSDSAAAGSTSAPCKKDPKVLTIQWDQPEAWCSEDGPSSGTTKEMDGTTLSIQVKGKADGQAVTTFSTPVSSNAFSQAWSVVDVLPVDGPPWKDTRELDAETSGVKTPTPLKVHFIPKIGRATKAHTALYDRTDPGATAPKKVGVECIFELEVSDFLLTIYGQLNYVRGWGKERLQLGDATLTGGFTLYSNTNHWGKRDTATGTWQYWDGTAWKPTPAAWMPDNSNHFGIAFYKSGTTWVCREDASLTWPDGLTDWPANTYTGAGNLADTTLKKWKTNIDGRWSDKFDIKRIECKSTKSECCRYKTKCTVTFTEVAAYVAHTIIIVYEDVRSDSGMWALGDTRDGLAPHEFGHLLGAPDEYSGVGTTQLGVTDSDGLVNGIDDNCLMGVGLSEPKKRHYKGVAEVLALLVTDQIGKTYTYKAVDKGANLANAKPPAPGGGGLSSSALGAIIGAIVGAIIGLIASGGNPLGAVAGAAAGALAGAGIGSLF